MVNINGIYKARPMSRVKLREKVKQIRQLLGLDKKMYFDIIFFIEIILTIIDPEFRYEIIERDKMPDCYALMLPEENIMKIREDVYDAAVRGDGRHRLTLAHELGHYFLHNSITVQFARIDENSKQKPYEDPEWQATAFAAELLIPYDLINKDMSVSEIVKKCGVSYQAAEYQLNKKINRN